MTPLRCACLVDTRDSKLLLVRVRQNDHWYLPGGKIEPHESAQTALQRELAEELGIVLTPSSIRYLYSVVGPAYDYPGDVELVCFSAQWDGDPRAHGEISEVQWLDYRDDSKFAPAVKLLCRKHLQGTGPNAAGGESRIACGGRVSQTIRPGYPRLAGMASGQHSIALGQCSYDEFPECSEAWAAKLGAEVIRAVDGPDGRLLIVRIEHREFWIAFDEFAFEISLEPQDAAAGERIASIYEALRGGKR